MREQGRPCREGDPIDTLHPYGASKAAADCLLRAGAEGSSDISPSSAPSRLPACMTEATGCFHPFCAAR